MKSRTLPLLLLLLLLTLLPTLKSAGQTVTIADWQGNKSGAISLTFDDSPANHWTNAAPILTDKGLRGTFAVITNSVDWDGARAAAQSGHEIGSHSTDGNALDVLDFATAAARMQQSHDAVETEIGAAIDGYQCHVIAWPFGKRRLDVVNDPAYKDLYVSARNAGNSLLAENSYNEADTTAWWKYGEGTCGLDHYFVIGDALMNSGISLTIFNNQLDLVETQGAWTVFTYHSVVDSGASGLSVNKSDFTNQAAALSARSDSLYIAPYGEVARYVRQRDDASASVTSNDGTTLVLSLTDTLDDSIYNVPLTLLVDAPAGWETVEASQGGEQLQAAIVDGTIIVDAVPDAGPVTITGSSPPALITPTVTITPLTQSTLQLSWDTQSDLQYEVRASDDLSTWDPLDPAIIVNGTGAIHNQEVPYPGTTRFYRLSVSSAP
jgi:peptidoglycan/xylan/chitin deacetylase (PgdA/CDA1 family)